MNLYFLRIKKRGAPNIPPEIIFPVPYATAHRIRMHFIDILKKYLFEEGDIVLPTKLSISGGIFDKKNPEALWKSDSLGDFITKMGGNPTKTAD